MINIDSLELRLAESGDWPAWSRMWAEYLRFYGSERSKKQFEITWARITNPEERMYCIVAVSGTTYPGFVNFLYHRSFWDDEDRCYLQDLFVEPSWRGKGVGARLISEVGKHADLAGTSGVYWLTGSDNQTARRLYDRVATLTPFIKYAYP